mmetsp:Transcript_5387/g.7773  ORF Transcript_5387/g.7773 Transcript_5387/m.7773 type:complete len:322 (+) Transcript_5387:3-968(+)
MLEGHCVATTFMYFLFQISFSILLLCDKLTQLSSMFHSQDIKLSIFLVFLFIYINIFIHFNLLDEVKLVGTEVVKDFRRLVEKPPTKGLVAVHCKRYPEITWVNNVTKKWQMSIYETCGESISSRSSIPFKNKGSEECTGFFQYLLDNYDKLPEINVFLQDDAFYNYSKEHLWHTPFANFNALENATVNHVHQSKGFLHYGENRGRFGKRIPDDKGYTAGYVAQVIDDLGIPKKAGAWITTRPKASFAVHRNRILANSRQTYEIMQQRILNASTNGEAHKRCCALEASWHVVFGEHFILPKSSTLDGYLDEISFKYGAQIQ